MISTALTFLIIGLVPHIIEAVTLSCGKTSQQTAVHCECSYSGDVEWLVNGISLTTCIKAFSSCLQDRTGYTFSMNSSADLYFLTINSHSYSRCGVYECRGLGGTSSKDSVEISISDTYLDTTWEPEEQIEPGNHTDGNFSVTSPCLFDVNVNTSMIQWYTVLNGNREAYFPKINSTHYITTSCQACKGVNATQIQTSFLHKECYPGQTLIEVSFAVAIYNKKISFPGVYCIFVPPIPPIPKRDRDCCCWIIIIIYIVISRLLYPQIWLLGYMLYRRQNKTKDFNNVQSAEIIMILLTGLPLIGFISCIWAYKKNDQDHTYLKPFKWAFAVGFIVGCVQPGFGLFITGAAYATYVQDSSAFFFTAICFILLVGTEVAPIIACIVSEIECNYYILFSAGYIVVWIIAVVIMVNLQIEKKVTAVTKDKISIKEPKERINGSGNEHLKHREKAEAPVMKGNTTTRELKERKDDSGNERLKHREKAEAPVMKGNTTTRELKERKDYSGNERLKHREKAEAPVMKGNTTTRELKERKDDFGNERLNVGDYTCDLCLQLVSHTLKGFCLEKNMFLCNSCLSKHKCKGKHLKHNQHDESGREKYFSCERKQREGHRNLPAHGYCLECMLYLCTECLIDHDEHELLWMPHHDAKTLDDICCFKTRTDRNSTIPLGFCKTCKMYICEECISRHNKTHITIFHQHKETQTIPKKCSECPKPMECYKLNMNKYLCADCYDSGSLWTKNTYLDEDSKTILKESKKCQLHNEVGDSPAPYSPTDVFCIVCNLYLCKECFKVHRRFRERWIATHRENLFTCKGCQEKNNVFPVECFCIKSKSFLCAVCFEESKMTGRHATKNYFRPETVTRLCEKPTCELHKVPFQSEERRQASTVYCLLCKTYMCDDCFKKHLRLKQVWTNHKKEMKLTCQIKFINNEVSPIRM